jgi:hypothetical protein
MWIAPHLTGGLGNRLFQLSAALGLGEKWNRDVVFFLPKCGPTNHGPFDTIFRMFPSLSMVETTQEWVVLEEPKRDFFNYLQFDTTPPSSKPLIVHGFRQSPKYFPCQGIHPLLYELLDQKRWQDLLEKYRLETETNKKKTWFLHVRLGDYKVLPHHQVNLQTYYMSCLTKVPQGSKLLFFSDEPHLLHEAFKQIIEALGHSFQVVEESEELESLSLMSQCWGGAITANSTFSWWGAYFAHTHSLSPETYRAFYPDNWGSGMPPPVDVCPSWGTVVSVTQALV